MVTLLRLRVERRSRLVATQIGESVPFRFTEAFPLHEDINSDVPVQRGSQQFYQWELVFRP